MDCLAQVLKLDKEEPIKQVLVHWFIEKNDQKLYIGYSNIWIYDTENSKGFANF